MLWNQVICASTSCTIERSVHAAAKARLYFRLRGDSPRMSGKALRRSAASRSMTLAPILLAPYISVEKKVRVRQQQSYAVQPSECQSGALHQTLAGVGEIYRRMRWQWVRDECSHLLTVGTGYFVPSCD